MDWQRFVGVPFADGGRSLSGCDCYGLFRLAFQAGTGVDLPAHDGTSYGTSDRAAVRALINGGKAAWAPVASGDARTFDAVEMVIEGCQHIGLVVRPGRMLHMPRDATSVIESYRTGQFAHALQRGGFYRHQALSSLFPENASEPT